MYRGQVSFILLFIGNWYSLQFGTDYRLKIQTDDKILMAGILPLNIKYGGVKWNAVLTPI
jgi:hypothetical protein